jgi:hypothetical protein
MTTEKTYSDFIGNAFTRIVCDRNIADDKKKEILTEKFAAGGDSKALLDGFESFTAQIRTVLENVERDAPDVLPKANRRVQDVSGIVLEALTDAIVTVSRESFMSRNTAADERQVVLSACVEDIYALKKELDEQHSRMPAEQAPDDASVDNPQRQSARSVRSGAQP